MQKRKRLYARCFWILCSCFLFGGNFSVFHAENARANAVKEWELLSSFTTYFNENDGGRCENIAIAASLINGICVQAFGEFSFNQTVGRRTAELGFKQAKIIVNGEYVLGVGGGVCQVSTTLYNAALKSGLQITEFHPHSLRVSYVPPSRDAMVSSSSDLRFFNPRPHAVKVKTHIEKNALKICVFGQKDGYRYEIISNIVGEIPPPPPVIKQGEREEILREERCGIESESFLEIYQKDKLISKKRLRKDRYLPTQGIFVKKT